MGNGFLVSRANVVRSVCILMGAVVGAYAGSRSLGLFDDLGPRFLWTPEPQPNDEHRASSPLLKAPADGPTEGEESVRPPHQVRRRDGPARALPDFTSMYDWPHEPPSPTTVDDDRFTEALTMLCGPATDHEVRSRHAPAILQSAREFGSDPFLLGALVYRESGCSQASSPGTGLTNLAMELYQQDISEGVYHYRAFERGRWVARNLNLTRHPFSTASLRTPEINLYFAAAFLRAWREQQRGLFAAFAQREYRHHVSHFIWGDKVGSARQENWILVDRRRLLEYYGARKPAAPAAFRGFSLGCPLDGCPRLVTSTLGDAREHGKRSHRGTDFESSRGEPVRAVADGVVLFAGVDWPGRGKNQKVPIYAQRSLERSIMGAGGLYVCIRHDSPGVEPIVSCYMHLDTATIAQGRRVARGEQIGKVGRTGIKVSAPHLHFELHTADGIQAAEEALGPLALGKPPVHAAPTTMAGQAGPVKAARPTVPAKRSSAARAKSARAPRGTRPQSAAAQPQGSALLRPADF